MLIQFTDKGLCCPIGGFYIDPWKPVAKAVISHGHSDHARPGNGSYLCHEFTKPILQLRLGDQHYETLQWNEQIDINGVKLSLHPAGHIIGSSQIRLEHKGEVCVFSGDYKVENDGISGQFEPVPCHTFITESTFGLPIYRWKPQAEIFSNMKEWISNNRRNNKTSVLIAYSLGKTQRILQTVAESTDHIFAHGAVYNTQQALIQAGWKFPEVKRVTADIPKDVLQQSVVLAPSGADASPWIRRFIPYAVGVCSGWMQVRGNVRRRNVDAGFALSDHADWKGLLDTIKATGAQMVYVTHGFQSALSRYLNENGIPSAEVKTEYGEEETEERSDTSEEQTESFKRSNLLQGEDKNSDASERSDL